MKSYGIERRDFMRWALAAGAATPFHQAFLPKLKAAAAEAAREHPVLWLQISGCSGCSISLLNSVHPAVRNLLLDEVVPGQRLVLRFHQTLMAGTGEVAMNALREAAEAHKGKYVMVFEGAVPTRHPNFGTLGVEAGKHVPMTEWVSRLASGAMAVINAGTCAAFGGISAAEPNPTGCVGVTQYLEQQGIRTPVINVPGCPCHPDWFVGTVVKVLLFGLPPAAELDEHRRPKLFFGKTVHNRCIYRDYIDEGVFAHRFGETGCMLELGCKGPFAHGDCPMRQWNGGVNWCIQANNICIGCTEPGFPDEHAPLYQRR